MREILFRAKRIDDGEWIEGFLFSTNEHIYIAYQNQFDDDLFLSPKEIFIEVDPETICQYTGLTDKNGRKIFDGDIIMHETAGKIKVKFEKSEFMVVGIDRTMFRAWLSSIHGNFRIIGNIFDNPELIGDQP